MAAKYEKEQAELLRSVSIKGKELAEREQLRFSALQAKGKGLQDFS